MRSAARPGSVYIGLAMLCTAGAGRSLDAAALLPGVHEAAGLRGGVAAWWVGMLTAALVGIAAGGRWARTQSIARTAQVAAPGQVVVFVTAEAVVRLANGQGPFDPDAIVGAALQAGLGLVLLLALALAWLVVLHCAPLLTASLFPPGDVSAGGSQPPAATGRGLAFLARGPPAQALR
ncbi:MAG: hypothetical protein QOE99_1622 [Actinomycetota bacterium]|nr:hypothetical protein [Actinomycetota bacterium]